MNDDFENLRITNLFELLDTVALFYYFSKKGIISKLQNNITEVAKNYLINLRNNNELKKAYYSEFPWSSSRYSFSGADSIYANSEFKDFFSMVKLEVKSYQLEFLKQAASKLFDTLKHSVQEFSQMLLEQKFGMGRFTHTPILSFININDFTSAFWQLRPSEIYDIGLAFKERYNSDKLEESLLGYLPWLKELKEIIIQDSRLRNEKLTKYLVEERFLNSLNLAIEQLEQLEKTSTNTL